MPIHKHLDHTNPHRTLYRLQDLLRFYQNDPNSWMAPGWAIKDQDGREISASLTYDGDNPKWVLPESIGYAKALSLTVALNTSGLLDHIKPGTSITPLYVAVNQLRTREATIEALREAVQYFTKLVNAEDWKERNGEAVARLTLALRGSDRATTRDTLDVMIRYLEDFPQCLYPFSLLYSTSTEGIDRELPVTDKTTQFMSIPEKHQGFGKERARRYGIIVLMHLEGLTEGMTVEDRKWLNECDDRSDLFGRNVDEVIWSLKRVRNALPIPFKADGPVRMDITTGATTVNVSVKPDMTGPISLMEGQIQSLESKARRGLETARKLQEEARGLIDSAKEDMEAVNGLKAAIERLRG